MSTAGYNAVRARDLGRALAAARGGHWEYVLGHAALSGWTEGVAALLQVDGREVHDRMVGAASTPEIFEMLRKRYKGPPSPVWLEFAAGDGNIPLVRHVWSLVPDTGQSFFTAVSEGKFECASVLFSLMGGNIVTGGERIYEWIEWGHVDKVKYVCSRFMAKSMKTVPIHQAEMFQVLFRGGYFEGHDFSVRSMGYWDEQGRKIGLDGQPCV